MSKKTAQLVSNLQSELKILDSLIDDYEFEQFKIEEQNFKGLNCFSLNIIAQYEKMEQVFFDFKQSVNF